MSKSEKAAAKTVFICQECGKESFKWLGRCPECQQWNTFVETRASATVVTSRIARPLTPARELSGVEIETTHRVPVTIAEFNRVLGGGLVSGSLVLIGGDPGIGKSTLLLQTAAPIARSRGKVVYVSGEETLHQTKLRAERLGIAGEGLYLLAENDLDAILSHIRELSPSLVVVGPVVHLRAGLDWLGALAGRVLDPHPLASGRGRAAG